MDFDPSMNNNYNDYKTWSEITCPCLIEAFHFACSTCFGGSMNWWFNVYLFTDCDTVHFFYIDPHEFLDIMWIIFICAKINFDWNKNIDRKFVATNDPVIWFFPILIGAHSQTEVSGWRQPNLLREEWYSFNYYLYTMEQLAWGIWVSCSYDQNWNLQIAFIPCPVWQYNHNWVI